MRTLALMTLAAGILAATPIPALAGTIVEDFDFIIPADSSTNHDYLSTTFAGFDPALGTLNTVTVSVTGTLTWVPVSIGQEESETLQFILETPVSAFQMFTTARNVSRDVDLDLNGAAAFAGSAPQQALLSVSDTSDGTFGGGALSGVVTYKFTSVTPVVPEPSTWAMMLVGFAGLGYAAMRRRGGVRAV